MTKQPHIKHFLSLLMIVVMAFTITPKRTVHEIFGCHDKSTTPYHSPQGNETTISKDGFHCACESQEFQTSFIEGVTAQLNIPQFSFAEITASPISDHLCTTEIQSAYLRGPPSLV